MQLNHWYRKNCALDEKRGPMIWLNITISSYEIRLKTMEWLVYESNTLHFGGMTPANDIRQQVHFISIHRPRIKHPNTQSN